MTPPSIRVFVLATLSSVLAGSCLAERGPEEDAIGYFDRQELLVAFYRSELHGQRLRHLEEEWKRAKESRRTEEATRLEAVGGELQELAHRQIAGEAPLTNVLEALRQHLAEVAREANVRAIVEQPLYRDERVPLVDVTARLVLRLPPVSR